tara:strand:- start:526 stop:825 length:300 start_codon:yes stop_codon:yes gene_type:complete
MKEFSTTNVKFHVSGNSWVMDCPALKIKGLPICPASYTKYNLLAMAHNFLADPFWEFSHTLHPDFKLFQVRQEARRQEAYTSIIAELSEAHSKSIREAL